MITMASRPIRNRAYQTFLILHVTLWFFIVASLVIHRPQDQGWIWAGCVRASRSSSTVRPCV